MISNKNICNYCGRDYTGEPLTRYETCPEDCPSTEIRESVIAKLHPKQIKVSPIFHAIIACLLRQEGWTDPELASLTITSDNFLLGMRKGDIGFNDFIGAEEDLRNNCDGVSDAAELSAEEKKYFLGLLDTITHH